MTKPQTPEPCAVAADHNYECKTLWLVLENFRESPKFRVALDADGKERELFHSYVDHRDGIVSHHINLTPYLNAARSNPAPVAGEFDWADCAGRYAAEGFPPNPDDDLYRERGVCAAVILKAISDYAAWRDARDREVLEEVKELRARLAKINTPEIADFLSAVENEAKHQRLRWGAEHDGGKSDADWFWLIGYLGGKAIHTDILEFPNEQKYLEKKLHRVVTIAAVALNWFAAIKGTHTEMRPGIAPPIEKLGGERG